MPTAALLAWRRPAAAARDRRAAAAVASPTGRGCPDRHDRRAGRLREDDPARRVGDARPPPLRVAVGRGAEARRCRAVASLAGLVEDVGACPHPARHRPRRHAPPWRASSSMRRVTDLACQLPAGSCVAVASRQRLAVPLARLRGHRLLVEFAARELAMTRLEAAMLLDTAGVRLEAGQLDRLVALTEGWPVGLYLAALSIQEQDGSQEAITQLGGGDRLVADYIRDEVLRDLAEHKLAFLRRTSILRSNIRTLVRCRVGSPRLRRGARPPHARRHPDRAGRSLRLAVSVQPALGGDAPRRSHPRRASARSRCCTAGPPIGTRVTARCTTPSGTRSPVAMARAPGRSCGRSRRVAPRWAAPLRSASASSPSRRPRCAPTPAWRCPRRRLPSCRRSPRRSRALGRRRRARARSRPRPGAVRGDLPTPRSPRRGRALGRISPRSRHLPATPARWPEVSR